MATRNTFSLYTLLCYLILFSPAEAANYFVATDGDDANPGTIAKPFATIQQAQQHVEPGDNVFLRGGTYKMKESHISQKKDIWAQVILFDKSGTPGKRIHYRPHEDERPVFDFSAVRPEGLRVHAFEVKASWVHFQGIEVVGVQVVEGEHTQSVCFANNGSHNVYELLSMHDGQAIGIYSVRGANNLFLNCDAYRNHDYTSGDRKGGNVDGFGCHPRKGDTGNVFRGCRAWFNSDDGYDCIAASESVRFENCWAMYNGYSVEFESLADGNGFKAGGYGKKTPDRIPDPIPRHSVVSCLAVRNRANGFYANHHIGGGDWFNNSGYRNGNNFNMLSRLKDNRTDVPGYDHKLFGNLSFQGDALVKIDESKCELENNSFQADLSISDFESLDESQLLQPRQANGELPVITFLKPLASSQAVGQGFTADSHESETIDLKTSRRRDR